MSSLWTRYDEKLRATPAFGALAEGGRWATGLSAEAAGWVLGALARARGRPALVVVPRESAAIAWVEGARLAGVEAESFTAPSLSPYQATPTPLSVRAQEVVALDRFHRGRLDLLVATSAGLVRRLPDPEELSGRALRLAPGDELGLDELARRLTLLGFERVDLVTDLGGFAVRGGLVDLFPAGRELPVRVDFFGDEVESMRSFEPSDQRSHDPLTELRILPLHLVALGEDAMAGVAAELAEVLATTEPAEGWAREGRERVELLELGRAFPGWEEMVPAVEEPGRPSADLFAWSGSVGWLVVFEPEEVRTELAGHRERAAADFERSLARGLPAPPPERLLQPPEVLEEKLAAADLLLAAEAPAEAVNFKAQRTEVFHTQLARFRTEVEAAGARGERVVLVAPPRHHGRLESFCESYGIGHPGRPLERAADGRLGASVEIVGGELTRGFRLESIGLVLVGEDQLFRRVAPRRRRLGSVFFAGLRDLKVGDFVVHRDHGIGQFVGLRTLDGAAAADPVPETLRTAAPAGAGAVAELLEIAYGADKTLLLPASGLDRLQRYQGFEGVQPKLDRLGGTSWSRKKQRVRAGMRRMAGDLLKLYAERQVAKAPPMGPDTDLQRQFEAAFDYEPTPDQVEAAGSVKRDLESERPMDRLLCGDVGFGKTEVAMRAAFKAVDGGYQVAVLAPTTILADQHLETFRRRFAGFPVEVDMVSRFRSGRGIADVRERLATGRIDILIGTHRLLNQDLSFERLGLLVIDEEQRFGVAQKERLRKLKKNVHVLAMTATPVPRTLQLSLAGVRDLSTIETPPRDRMSVETAIVPFGRQLIREAIEYELDRNGQIYYVFNRVETITEMAEELREIVPRARLVVGHGQLPEGELARRMHAFKAGDYDLLLATTIIENGIDIPNVNTILVHRADRFGLAQLYQLRGRVGRSRRLGYCYLLTPEDRVLTEVSRKRLEAIREFTELGAGFRVAARDLEIRGAGDLLGAEQSGHISAVGLETYLKMLEETVQELQGKALGSDVSTAIELPIDWTIPTDYVPQQNLRLELYRQIAAAERPVEEIVAELRDRFGEPPAQVFRLLEVAGLKGLAERLKVQAISARAGDLLIRFRQDTPVRAEELIRFVGEHPEASFSPTGVLTCADVPTEQLVARALETLTAVTGDEGGASG